MSIIIKADNISKVYRLGEIGTGTLSQDLHRWWTTQILKRDDPFLKIGQANNRAEVGDSNVVYSLKDINFEIAAGQIVGIIGKNGAGKSTLLKILSRITTPTTGQIKIKGRIASLLEVGTGFHPELTGIENIFLNGAILGMSRQEIRSKLEEIVEFSGIKRYIDTPVKRYSSGMYVRLAFSVAAHLESEILVVDEVLAVGDIEFQKKCLGKMDDISKHQGRTVLFVSHNMDSIMTLCNIGLILENGQLIHQGSIENIVAQYLKTSNQNNIIFNAGKYSNSNINVVSFSIASDKGKSSIAHDEEIIFTAIISNEGQLEITFICGIQIFNSNGKSVLHFYGHSGVKIKGGEIKRLRWKIRNQFLQGVYSTGLVIVDNATDVKLCHYNVDNAFISHAKDKEDMNYTIYQKNSDFQADISNWIIE